MIKWFRRKLASVFQKASRLKPIPVSIRIFFAAAWLTLTPLYGGSDPINGAQVLIRINDSTGVIDVAFQKDVSFDTSNALIDISNKTSGRRSKYLVGRLEEEVSLDMFWSDEASYTLLRAAARNGTTVQIVRAYDANNDGSFANIEQADMVITKLSEKFPDQEGAMVNISFRVSGNWGAVV